MTRDEKLTAIDDGSWAALAEDPGDDLASHLYMV